MKHDGVSVTALMVLVAFAIERVTTGVLFMMSFRPGWKKLLLADSEAKPGEAERRYKVYYFTLASALALAVLVFSPGMRVLQALDVQAPWILNVGLTCLIIVAGADRIGEFLESKGAAGGLEKTPKPVQIEGTLTLREERAKAQAA